MDLQGKFEVKAGTTAALKEIGVSNNTAQSVRDYGVMSKVECGWSKSDRSHVVL